MADNPFGVDDLVKIFGSVAMGDDQGRSQKDRIREALVVLRARIDSLIRMLDGDPEELERLRKASESLGPGGLPELVARVKESFAAR